MAQVHVNPYQFEPHHTDSDDSNRDGETENTPLNRQNDTSLQFLCIYFEINNNLMFYFGLLKTGKGG